MNNTDQEPVDRLENETKYNIKAIVKKELSKNIK